MKVKQASLEEKLEERSQFPGMTHNAGRKPGADRKVWPHLSYNMESPVYNMR